MFKLNNPLTISRAIFALSLVSLVVMMGSSMATPSLALYAGDYPGANEFLVGAVIAGFAVGRLVSDVPAGFLADKMGISRTMCLGLAVLVASSLVAAVAPSYWILLSARILEGVGSAIYVSAAIAFVLLASEASRRGTAMGTYQSILMTGPIVGPIAGAPVAAYFGLNAPYFAFAAMMAAALGIVAFLGSRGTFAIKRPGADHKEGSFRAGGLSLYVNTAGIATFGFAFLRSGVYSTGLPLFSYGSLSLSLFDVGAILTAASLANLAASYFSGRLTNLYGMRKPLFAAILSSAILVALIPFSASAIHLLVIMMLIGLSSGFFGQSIAWAAEQIEGKVRSSAAAVARDGRNRMEIGSHLTRGIGINRMIGDIGLILGPLFVGYLVSLFSSDPLAWFMSFGMTSVVLGLASLFVLRPARAALDGGDLPATKL
jgi:MFS family permease